MKKIIISLALLLISVCVYAQMPLKKVAPARAAFFKEKSGKAIVWEGQPALTYWLYQLSPSDIKELMVYILSYVETIGYVVDYNSFSGMFINTDLAMSVRSMMVFNNRNVSVTISDNSLIINVDASFDGSISDRTYYFMSWDLVKE